MKQLTEAQRAEKKGILELYTCIQTEGSKAGYPNILVRFTGCTHRCYFGEGGFCDSWYTSWSPEKSLYSINDVREFMEKNPQISSMMITGGSPTMYPEHVNALVNLMHEFHQGDAFVTIETEGSHFIQTDYPIDLVSISPKFSNSLPVLGTTTPDGKPVTTQMILQHEKFRLNYDAIGDMIDYHKDYHFKPVWNPGDEYMLEEIEEFRVLMGIPRNKTWMMPGGDTRERLLEIYPAVIEKCIELGYNFSGREHILAYDTLRYV